MAHLMTLQMSSPAHLFPAPAVEADPDTAWAQVLARDPSANFVYAVTTTGICCRPSCPSRRPARTHVRFFPTVEAAVTAGFRPCLRCRPQQPQTASPRDTALVRRVCEYLGRNVDRAVTLDELGVRAGVTGVALRRKFEHVLGITPRQFQVELRASGFRRLLADGAGRPLPRITDAVYEAGYSAGSRLYSNAQQKLGMTPSRFRDGGRGETIHFVIAPCTLGFVLVAATPVGVCSVALGDTPETLEADLRQRFRQSSSIAPATAVKGPSYLQQAVETVLSQLTDHPAAAQLPLDLRATVFQQRVWQALTAIPRGETRSYSQVAASLGQPTAARAVARACASNPVALLVPCHRVVGADGGLSGYRWGKQRKQAILEMERRAEAKL